MTESESGSDVDLFDGPLSHEIPHQSRVCSKSGDLANRHKKKRAHVRTQLSDSDPASDNSDEDEDDTPTLAPQTGSGWLKESISEIKSLISTLSQKVDRNEKSLRELQNTCTR